MYLMDILSWGVGYVAPKLAMLDISSNSWGGGGGTGPDVCVFGHLAEEIKKLKNALRVDLFVPNGQSALET
jgi:hypothetical protein